ncbi:MAG: SDR family oxidoreductase [Acidipropionibacterium sp.]|nr:SDR family oxidoreductase [Acidipropionibacterium sp.]
MADINGPAAEEAASRISAQCPDSRVVPVTMNVADLESTRGAIESVVRTFGGVDVYVSNAGVVRAAGVVEQELSDFDAVTAVNYRGYFIGVKAVTPVMAAQHAADPELWFDIVEVNSKSGLTGSKRNFAYAGSKFGGIGLTQSFALELVDRGIKVNAVCPGNFLDGPLWQDPENGLLVQYLRAGKVPGARTVEDVLESYRAKVPIGRGCRPEDVLRAICYAVEQQYETGQAIPVTGGQTMLN